MYSCPRSIWPSRCPLVWSWLTCVNGPQVGVLEQFYQVSFSHPLECHQGTGIEPEMCPKLVHDLSNQLVKGSLQMKSLQWNFFMFLVAGCSLHAPFIVNCFWRVFTVMDNLTVSPWSLPWAFLALPSAPPSSGGFSLFPPFTWREGM